MFVMVGILLALIGTLFAGLASVYMGAVAKEQKFDNRENLVLQYKSEIVVVLLVMVGFALFAGQSMFPTSISGQTRGILAIIGVVGFGGIFFLYKGFAKLNPAIVLIIAQLNIFIMYFVNARAFVVGENLSVLKIVIAIIFFLTVAQFLLPGKKHQKKGFCIKNLLPDFGNLKINKFALYPILTAICRTGFTFAFIYLNKKSIFTPVQSVFFTETAVGVVAFIALFFMKGKVKSFSKKILSAKISDFKPYILLGIFQIVSLIFFAYAYVKTSANMINVIRLFQIIITAIFSWIIFKEKMSQRNIILMGIAFCVLVAFVLV